MALLKLTVPGDPVVKARPRHGANSNTFTPARTRRAEKYLTGFLKDAWGEHEPTDQVVGLSVQFYCATRRRSDGDNLLKLVTDSMNKVVVVDDSQIEEWYCRVHRGVGAEAARTEIFMYSLPTDSEGVEQ